MSSPATPQPPEDLRTAIDRAEALLDGLLEAYLAHHRARHAEPASTPRPLDVGRQRLIDQIAQVQRTADRLKRVAAKNRRKTRQSNGQCHPIS